MKKTDFNLAMPGKGRALMGALPTRAWKEMDHES